MDSEWGVFVAADANSLWLMRGVSVDWTVHNRGIIKIVGRVSSTVPSWSQQAELPSDEEE